MANAYGDLKSGDISYLIIGTARILAYGFGFRRSRFLARFRPATQVVSYWLRAKIEAATGFSLG